MLSVLIMGSLLRFNSQAVAEVKDHVVRPGWPLANPYCLAFEKSGKALMSTEYTTIRESASNAAYGLVRRRQTRFLSISSAGCGFRTPAEEDTAHRISLHNELSAQ